VTAIVGPNGCGKSNISDAIRWVLGEKSYKMLRGGKMEDMVFNGTEFRQPMGYCEVSMIFSNDDNTLPIEYTEVEITRKYFRQGDSEYYINRTPCRQKDIAALLMDTGIGSNSYSMVEQGRIDYIVRASADERRFLIEEAAGISKYKNKKEEAMRKLERTQNNILRINDIVAEVEKNIKYAERQARKAQKFKERYDVLKRLETYKAIEDIAAIEASEKDITDKKENFEAKQTELASKLEEERKSQAVQAEEIEVLNETLSNTEEEKYQYLNEISQFKSAIDFNTIRISELKARNESNLHAIEESEQKIEQLTEQITRKEEEYGHFCTDTEACKEKYETQKTELDTAITDIAALEEAIKAIEAERDEELSKATIMRNEIANSHIEISNLENQVKRIQQEKEKLHEQKNDYEGKLVAEQHALHNKRDQFNLFTDTHANTKKEKRDLENNLEKIRTELLNKRVMHKEIQARLLVLQDLEKNYSGFQEGAKKALKLKDQHEEQFQSIALPKTKSH